MVTLKGEVVEFRFYRPEARQVHLAGDFNGWRGHDLPMSRTADGYWTAKVRLPAGEFKFRYLADGQWYCDYAAFGVEPGPYGMDSLVRVPQPTLRVANARESELEVAAA